MNMDFIYTSGSSFLVATIVLVVLGLLLLGGVLGLWITLKRERTYARTALPSLFEEEDEDAEAVTNDDMQIIPESVFDVEEAIPTLEDQESNQLMAAIDKARKVQVEEKSQTLRPRKTSGLTNVFKKKD